MVKEKILTIEAIAWSAEAELELARSIVRAPCCTVDDYRRILASDPDAQLYAIRAGDERVVCYVILRVLRFAGGAEGEILAAAGRLQGGDLTRDVLPALERMFAGVTWHRITTARPGLVRKLERQGYQVTHYVLRKPAAAADCAGRLAS